ncbi:MAG: energy transducer TonB [Krumholzibacteria bacterium]|nr:energy transducer TonB [Candidatus Krumholzibacteria bacterium]
MSLRRVGVVAPAAVLAVVLNLLLLWAAGHLSRQQPVVRDHGPPVAVDLVTIAPEEAPPPERVADEPPPPEVPPRPQFMPELSLPAPGEAPAIAVTLDLDPAVFAAGPVRGDLVFEAGALDEAPRAKVRAEPPYPYRARQRGIEGQVQVRLLVRADGSIGEVTILAADPEGVFEDAVRQTVPRWSFSPGMIGGRPVASWVVTTVHFTLGEGARR